MNLPNTLAQAAKECNHPLEEEGGIILKHKETGNYDFVKLRNSNTGTDIAPCLWTADRYEYADKIIPRVWNRAWEHYASFHTHPRFVAVPSGIDLGTLFPGFPVNFIYSKLQNGITEWFTEKSGTSYVTSFRLKDDKLEEVNFRDLPSPETFPPEPEL